ncbi:MAG: hypothetical protein JSU73_10110 [candidate division WOR-3 bacterium]|nr:MAG: hypothetical protein JSU73_10110 [candidate division WOR-3 bacterium]
MLRRRHALLPLFLAALVTPASLQAWMIESHEIPLEIDTYGRFRQNSTPFVWSAFDSLRTHWDLTRHQGGQYARVGLRDYEEGRYPAPESMEVDEPSPDVCEMDTLGSGQEQWSYLYMGQLGLYLDGIDFSELAYRFIGNYIPDALVYSTPMYRGQGWASSITWKYEILPGIDYIASEQHTKRIVAQGKVRVPMSGDYYWPCMVIRDYMVFTDNLGSDDRRWIYEWVTPAHFLGGNGLAAAQSQNGASPDFLLVDNFFQMAQCTIPDWDLIPPQFDHVTVWPDTDYAGPFLVSAEIIDDDDVGEDSLFYRVNQGDWVGVPSDSWTDESYFYTIPAVTQTSRIDYYVWAMDDFCDTEEIDFWTTWPVCSPESTMVTFHVTMTGITQEPGGRRPGMRAWPNPFTSKVGFSLDLPGLGDARIRLYDAAGELVRTLDIASGFVTWDGRDDHGRELAAGSFVYRLEADNVFRTGRLTLQR